MKNLIELKPTKLLAVKIPNDVKKTALTVHKDGLIFYSNHQWEKINLPPNEKFKLIGIAKKIKEKDLKKFIFSVGERSGFGGLCYPYPKYDNTQPDGWTSSIIHSFKGLMRTNGLYEDGKFSSIVEKDNFVIVARS